MMYTIDASVFVRAYTMQDERSPICNRLLTHIHDQNIALFEPTLVLMEIAGSISREFNNPLLGRISASNLMRLSQVSFIEFNSPLAEQGFELAADLRLRGADATYVAIAQHCATTLISLDREHLQRASRVIPVVSPEESLAMLDSSPQI